MKDRTYQAVLDALDLLATARPAKTNGKVTAVNLAKEAGISKATLYRYFDEHADLRNAYDAMRRNGIQVVDEVPETIQHAYRLLKEEVRSLRSELGETKRKANHNNKLKAHQILLLWTENKRLENEVRRLQTLGSKNNVVAFSSMLGADVTVDSTDCLGAPNDSNSA
jgi:hypothetical protein